MRIWYWVRYWLGLRVPLQQPVGREFVVWVEYGRCPDCGSTDKWLPGPRAGWCRNMRCAGCDGQFNVAMKPLKMIQRIGETGKGAGAV